MDRSRIFGAHERIETSPVFFEDHSALIDALAPAGERAAGGGNRATLAVFGNRSSSKKTKCPIWKRVKKRRKKDKQARRARKMQRRRG